MKRIVYGLLSILGFLIGLSLILPLFIDVNQYKGEISAKVKEVTGRDLVIKGPIQLSLFPSPALKLHQVKLANHPQAHRPHLIIFEKATVKAAFLPLLQKKIHLTKVSLKEAKIDLEKLPDGKMNWDLSPQKAPSPEDIPSAPSSSQGHTSAVSFDVGVDKISIEEADITYRDGSQETSIKDLSLEASLQSLTGPYTAEGQLKFQQQTLKFDLKAGKLEEAQPIEAEFRIGEGRMKAIGVYTQSSQTFKGSIDGQLDPTTLQKITGKTDLPHFTKDKIHLQALLIASPSRINLGDLKLKVNETIVNGALTAALGNISQVDGTLKNLPGQGSINFTLIQEKNNTQGQLKANVQRLRDLLAWLKVDPKNLPPHLLGKCLISTRYALLKETLHLHDLMLTLQEAHLQGDIEYKLNQKVPFVRVNLKTPKVESFMPRTDTKVQKPLGAGQIQGSLQGDAQSLVFDVQTTLGTFILALKGQAQNLEKKPTLSVDINGRTTNLGAFLVDLGFVSKSTYRNASLTGRLAGDLENLQLNTQTTLDGLSLGTSGTVKQLMTLPSFDLQVNVTHPNVRNFLKLPSHTPAIAQGSVSLTTHLKGDTTQFTLNDFKAMIGQTVDIRGNLDVNRKDEKTKVKGALTATSLNLDLLMAMTSGQQQASPEPQLMLVALKTPPAYHVWSQEPISFAFLKNLEADVQVLIHKLKRKDITITNLKVSSKVQNGVFEAPLTGSFYGGKLQGNFRMAADNTLALSLDLQEAELASLIPHHSGQIKLVGGKFSLHSAFSTRGRSIYELIANFAGPLKMNARNGVINGFDLQAISQRLKQINNIQGLLGLMSNFMAKGQTTFKSFDGDIVFKNGIGTIQSMQLVADGGAGQATGTINLPVYLLNIATEFRLTDHPELPPFKMYLTGPLDNPQRNLETQALQNYLIQNVFKGVIDQLSKGKGKIGDVIGSILGGQDQGPQPAQPDQGKASQKPEKVVKDLFKKLF